MAEYTLPGTPTVTVRTTHLNAEPDRQMKMTFNSTFRVLYKDGENGNALNNGDECKMDLVHVVADSNGTTGDFVLYKRPRKDSKGKNGNAQYIPLPHYTSDPE